MPAFSSLLIKDGAVKLFLSAKEKYKGALVVENSSENPLFVSLSFVDEKENGRNIRRSCSSWISFEERSFTIPAKEIKTLKYTIEVPEYEQGGYWTGILYEYGIGDIPSPGGMNVGLKMAIEQGFQIKIPNTLNGNLKINYFEANIINQNTINLSIEASNVGNTPEKVTVLLMIEDEKENVIKQDKRSFNIYPEKTKTLDYSYTFEGKSNINKVIAVFDPEHGETLIEKKSFTNKKLAKDKK